MDTENDQQPKPIAWQPLTFGGVANFAFASLRRLLFVELAVAMIAASSILWYLSIGWQPAVEHALSQLPDEGIIRNGVLEWPLETPQTSVRNTLVSIVIAPSESSDFGHLADVQVELHKTGSRFRSVFGHIFVPYPPEWEISFARSKLEPWWGAWQPAVFAIIWISVVTGLLVSWQVFATLYTLPAQAMAQISGVPSSLKQSWKLASASLMPGALLISAAIVAYSLNRLNLIQFLFAYGLHFFMSWIFVLAAPLRLPRPASKKKTENPFLVSEEAESAVKDANEESPFKASAK